MLSSPRHESFTGFTPTQTLLAHYDRVRATTMQLVAPLSPEDCQVQSMPDASPVKWHLGHTTWFFETFVLQPYLSGYELYNPAFRMLFNSYYNGIGAAYSRPHRGLLTRPALEEVLTWRRYVDAAIHLAIEAQPHNRELAARVELGLHHEQQHQELILMDIKHLFWSNPLRPAYLASDGQCASHLTTDEPNGTFYSSIPVGPRANSLDLFSSPTSRPLRSCDANTRDDAVTSQPERELDGSAIPLSWLTFRGGVQSIGHHGAEQFAYDNESPAHDVLLHPYQLSQRLITHGEYLTFIEDGGYERPELWLSLGWDTVTARGWQAPMYWEKRGREWAVFTLRGMQPLEHAAPVLHLSYFEADAFARWAGARLPTEAEWEAAAKITLEADSNVSAPRENGHATMSPNLLEKGNLVSLPASVGTGTQLTQLLGDAWEWTCSAYSAYPGYRPPAGAIGEYNGKFMCNQYVLRGGSLATPSSHIRHTYRNFFPPDARWPFTGLRLARDA